MPYQSHGLSATLCAQLSAFVAANDLPVLYRSYEWENDTHAQGFPDIQALELRLTTSEISTGITIDDVRAVAVWGAMRNRDRIVGQPVVMPPNTLTVRNGLPQPSIEHSPANPINTLALISGLGPTYQSKVLRFALPSEYGAIDTRVVRVFGQGDPASQQHNWLNLQATLGMHKGRATGWSIPATQRHWPDGFSAWINILRYIAAVIPSNCPHPQSFVQRRLRQQGAWTCADVEMALFSYASAHV